MNKEDQEFEKQVAEMQEADKKIRFCAFYQATKGITVPATPLQVQKLFAELKTRLANGSWRNLSHMRADVLGKYSVQKEKRV